MRKLVRYTVGGANVLGIGTFPTHSTIFFYRGRELDDASGLLKGSGKDSRFVTLREPAEAESPAVKRLIRQAFKLQSSGKPATSRGLATISTLTAGRKVP
jgi:hypothetical protein